MAKRGKAGSARAEKRDIISSASSVKIKMVDIEEIQQERNLQMRVRLDDDTVREYASRMVAPKTGHVEDKEGVQFEPIELVESDSGTLYLVDGWHRLEAAKKKKIKKFQARIKPGNRKRALELSLIANARHGLRRTRSDKQRAIRSALNDDEWVKRSDGWIADMCGVSQPTVSALRRQMVDKGLIEHQPTVTGKDGREITVTDIGSDSTPRTQKSFESDAKGVGGNASPGKVLKRSSSGETESLSAPKASASHASTPETPRASSGAPSAPVEREEEVEEAEHDDSWAHTLPKGGIQVLKWDDPGLGGWKQAAKAYSTGHVAVTPLPEPTKLMRCMEQMLSVRALARAYVETSEGTAIIWSVRPIDDVPAMSADLHSLKVELEELLEAQFGEVAK